jgi:hypothetical protein
LRLRSGPGRLGHHAPHPVRESTRADSARRPGSCRSCSAGRVSVAFAPSTSDTDCGPLATLRPFAPPGFHRASTLLRPLLTPGPLSRARSPRVRTCTFDPCRQALPGASFGDCWISRSLARSSPAPGLTACSCSYGRVFATPCFQLGLTASTLGFATLLVTRCGYLLSGNKYMPMSGTLGSAVRTGDRADRVVAGFMTKALGRTRCGGDAPVGATWGGISRGWR